MKLAIPEACLVNHTGIIGKAGSGKTNTAKGFAEFLLEKGERVCAIDPTGVWWGLRSKDDGKRAAFPVVVFGGRHADVPLQQGQGSALAEIIGTTNTPAILDTKLMSVGERTRFFTDFAETLLRKNIGPLHLFIDEAHCFAQQGRVADPQSGKMLHAANNLVSLGRSTGLRIVLIRQRPAKLHKDSLTQVETLIAHRLIAPQDRNAVEDWIGEWADPKEGKEILKGLPSLKTGDGWVWSPEIGILEKISFPKIKTYDSGKTPDGQQKDVVLAKIDMTSIEERLGAVAQEIKANDPAALKARIKELQNQIEKSGKPVPPNEEVISKAEHKGYMRGKKDGYSEALKAVAPFSEKLRKFSGEIVTLGEDASDLADGIEKWTKKIPEFKEPMPAIQERPRAAFVPRVASSDENLAIGERKILSVLAQYRQGRSKRQVAMLTAYSVNSGGFNNYLSKLRSKGWMQGTGERLLITQDGLSVLGDYEPLPTGQELLQHWFNQLEKATRAILEALSNAYPESLSKDQVAEATGYSVSSGGFNNALSRLRTLELIEGSGSALSASPDLFQEAA